MNGYSQYQHIDVHSTLLLPVAYAHVAWDLVSPHSSTWRNSFQLLVMTVIPSTLLRIPLLLLCLVDDVILSGIYALSLPYQFAVLHISTYED